MSRRRLACAILQSTTMRRSNPVSLSLLWLTLVALVSLAIFTEASLTVVPGQVVAQARRLLNLGNILGSATTTDSTNQQPYTRIMGHPVFQVTTSYGGAYMNMEKLIDQEMDDGSNSLKLDQEDLRAGRTSLSSDQNQYRQIFLYYMDPDDALAAHAEFKQMEQMEKTDVRISCVSLAKAINSAANLGQGLLTGQPIDKLTGRVPPTRDGGSVRHKIMPPKKQLYYAARCRGKERVGFFTAGNSQQTDDSASRDVAVAAILGNSALAYRNSNRRQAKRDRKIAAGPKNALEGQYAHMDGHVGIPVFYAQGMERRQPLLKGLISGNGRETPLFFNYEDLQEAWRKTRVAHRQDTVRLPEEPNVEVFNLVDVLTSMERDQARRKKQAEAAPPIDRLLAQVTAPFKRRLSTLSSSKKNAPLGLDTITFVPSSDACRYKESITARGNGKARLRPMR